MYVCVLYLQEAAKNEKDVGKEDEDVVVVRILQKIEKRKKIK